MNLSNEQFEKIAPYFYVKQGNVKHSDNQVLNAILYVAEHGYQWRGLPKRFGNWHTIYTRMNRQAKNGVLDRVFAALQTEGIININVEVVSLDSISVKVHPDGTGALKKGPQAIGKSRGRWTTKIHMVAADTRTAVTFSLSPGQAHDAPHGRVLIQALPAGCHVTMVMMDRAQESDETRQLVLDLGISPVVPPKCNRIEPWEQDKEMYKKRNKVKRLFRHLKGFRRIFSPVQKLDVMYGAFIYFALIIEAVRLC